MLSQLNQRFDINELHTKKKKEKDTVVNKDWCRKEKEGGP